jgi:hypothetical protein
VKEHVKDAESAPAVVVEEPAAEVVDEPTPDPDDAAKMQEEPKAKEGEPEKEEPETKENAEPVVEQAPEEPTSTSAPEEPTSAPEEPTSAPEEPSTIPEKPATAPEDPDSHSDPSSSAAPEPDEAFDTSYPPTTSKITLETAKNLRQLIFSDSNQIFNPAWTKQGFFYTKESDMGYGLIQLEGGPCGVVAAVQAFVLREILFKSRSDNFKNPGKKEQVRTDKKHKRGGKKRRH